VTLRRRAPVAALEAAAEGATVALPDPGVGIPSSLEQLLAKGRVRATLAMLGPAFVASVAYVDPGNFATNVQGGAKYGYLLLWVVLAANLIAMLIQYLSAKLGIVTDRDLPEVVRERFPRAITWGMWIQAEVMAMSTDIAEFLGAALGLNLLFGVPLLPAGLITGVIAFAILELQTHGFRRFELAITALLGIIFAGFLYEALRIGPSAHASLRGLIPGLQGTGSLYLAVGIIGATVMPHVIYLHSALTNGRMPCRNDGERSRVLRFERPRGPQHDPAGARAARPSRRRRGGARVRRRPARLGRLLLERRHLRGPGRDERVHQRPHPAARAARCDDDSRPRRAGRRD
jgi:manganese transport protein